MTSPLVLVAAPKVQPEVQAVVPAARAARAEAPPQHKPVTGPRDFRSGRHVTSTYSGITAPGQVSSVRSKRAAGTVVTQR